MFTDYKLMDYGYNQEQRNWMSLSEDKYILDFMSHLIIL